MIRLVTFLVDEVKQDTKASCDLIGCLFYVKHRVIEMRNQKRMSKLILCCLE